MKMMELPLRAGNSDKHLAKTNQPASRHVFLCGFDYLLPASNNDSTPLVIREIASAL
jgi:hypothetical protein